MKKLLNTLFVTSEDAYLTLDGENVVVNREKQVTARFPLHALAGIISFSYAGASPALMGACAKRDVSLSFCTPRGRFLARTCGVSNGNVLLRRTQYRTADDPPQACRIARMMVFGKIYNARWSIERTCRDHAMRAGAWIEIAEMVDGDFTAGSLPSRERGLKLQPVKIRLPVAVSLPSRSDGDSRTTILPPNLAPVPIPHNLSPARPKHLHMS